MMSAYLSLPSMVTPIGSDAEEVAKALFSGTPGLIAEEGWLANVTRHVGRVRAPLASIPDSLSEFACRNNQLLLSALRLMESDVAALKARHGADRIGVIIGSSTSGIASGEHALAQQALSGEFPASFDYRQQEIGTPAIFAARYFALTGPAFTISTACTSSTQAFLSAKALLDANLCDAVIVGGVDSLCKLTVQGFSALESYSSGRCQPFAADRDGINIGEGAILFVMSRDATPFRFLGGASSSDAYHISAPQPEGEGAERAIREALRVADISAEQVDYVNLHGTCTPKNDEMEANVMHRVFGAKMPCSSTKALTGHMLGAAGAMEVAACVLALASQKFPVQTKPMPYDPSLPVLNLVTDATDATLTTVVSTNYAFGGSNVALVIQRNRE